jgi:putative peptidoglycan lipid II flippase
LPSHFRLVRSAGAAAVATLSSRVLGLVRDQVLAALFGAGNEMDAFVVAFRVPNLLRDLFAEGSMSAALVPTFSRYLTLRGKPQAWRLANNLLNALLLVTGAITAVGIAFAPAIVAGYAADFASVPGKLELTVALTRIVLPFLMLVAVAAAMMGMLNSLHHYFMPSLSPAMFNIVTIGGAFTLVPLSARFGWPPIAGVAVSAVLGGIAQIALQWPPLRREGFRYRPMLDWSDAGLRQVLLLMGPGTIGLAATQVNIFVNTLLATGQGTGAVSWLTYAFRIMYLPIGLFGVSVATAMLPAVSERAALNDEDGMREAVSRALALTMMLNVPATFGLLALATPIVKLLFEHGRFLATDTSPTATALQLYACGLIGYSAARIASPTFYALNQSRVPVIVSAGTITLNVLVSLLLVRFMGFQGLALGTSISAIVNGGVLIVLLGRRLHGLHGRRLFASLLKIVAASLVMLMTVLAIGAVVEWVIPGDGTGRQIVRLAATIGAGLAALAAAAAVLRLSEFAELVATIQRQRT